MYSFEREIGGFKKKVKNRSKVEGSICQTYILKETYNFCSYYFEPHVQSRRTKVSRNDDSGENSIKPSLLVFNPPGCAVGQCKDRWLTGSESKSTHLHILLNRDELESFRR